MSRLERNSGTWLAAAESKRQHARSVSAKPCSPKLDYLVAFLIGVGAMAVAVLVVPQLRGVSHLAAVPTGEVTGTSIRKPPASYYELLAMPPDELGNAEGTPVLLPNGIAEPIECIGVGRQVVSRAADGTATRADSGIDPGLWRVVRLKADDPQRGAVAVSLLRPVTWIDATSAEAGHFIHLSVPEVGIEGWAEVRSIEACPIEAIGPSEGVVAGTFATEKANTVGVYLDVLDEPIRTTPGHPFYSVERNTWVAAGQLQSGEHVRTSSGKTAVQRVETETSPRTVYNLEVCGTHTYFVSKAQVWVHNGCEVVVPKGTPRDKVAGKWPAAVTTDGQRVYVHTFHAEAVRLAREGAIMNQGIKVGWAVLSGAGELLSFIPE